MTTTEQLDSAVKLGRELTTLDLRHWRGYTVEGLQFEFSCRYEPEAVEGALPL